MQVITELGRALERICIYGAPKVGKTRLVTSLPWGPYWGERAVLIGADVAAKQLEGAISPADAAASATKSVLSHNRDRLVVVVPDGKPSWMEEAVQIARRDWKREFKDVGTLIWDTMTLSSQLVLREYSDMGVFSDKHAVQVGNRASGSWHTSPMEGDYGAAQNTIAFLHEHLWTQGLHLIVVFHEDFMEPKGGGVDGLVGGPATVGKKAIRWIPAKYDTVLYMQRTQEEKSRVVVNTKQRGIWVAGIRGPQLGLPAQVVLDEDPREFWNKLVVQQ